MFQSLFAKVVKTQALGSTSKVSSLLRFQAPQVRTAVTRIQKDTQKEARQQALLQRSWINRFPKWFMVACGLTFGFTSSFFARLGREIEIPFWSRESLISAGNAKRRNDLKEHTREELKDDLFHFPLNNYYDKLAEEEN